MFVRFVRLLHTCLCAAESGVTLRRWTNPKVLCHMLVSRHCSQATPHCLFFFIIFFFYLNSLYSLGWNDGVPANMEAIVR